MSGLNHIVEESGVFVERFLAGKLESWVSYHDLRHTRETVEAAREIAEASGLAPEETEAVLLAAWFHDTGYTETVKGHEARSVVIAEEFLGSRAYPPARMRVVTGCIMATMVPQRPKTLPERVICDADMIYLGRTEFFAKNDLLKNEMEKREGVVYSDADWLRRSLAFLEGQGYHTDYCREQFSSGLIDNINTLRKQLAAAR